MYDLQRSGKWDCLGHKKLNDAARKGDISVESHVVSLLFPAIMLGPLLGLSIAMQMTLRHALLTDKRLRFCA